MFCLDSDPVSVVFLGGLVPRAPRVVVGHVLREEEGHVAARGRQGVVQGTGQRHLDQGPAGEGITR